MFMWLTLLSDWSTSILWFLGWQLHVLKATITMFNNFTAPVNRGALVSLILAGTCALVLMGWSNHSAERPYKSLEAFIDFQERETKVASLADLPVEALKVFSDVTCLQGPDLPSIKNALRRQLLSVPESVRSEIIDNALIEGMSLQSMVQNTTIGIETGVDGGGSAHSYMGFWSTEYIASPKLSGPAYSTCVLVTGMRLDVAEEIAGYEVSKTPKLVATEPCRCLWFMCASCPVFKEVVSKRPILKRHRLTLQNQINLHNWMVALAIDKARTLVQSRVEKSWLPFSSVKKLHTMNNVDGNTWEALRIDSFRGPDDLSEPGKVANLSL